MAERITVTTGTAAGGSPTGGPRLARYIVAGQTQFGKVTPQVCTSMADYAAKYGARSGGADMYDAAEFFFANQGGELVVQRAYGPSAVNSTITLDSKITVTSRSPGAYYDAITAEYTTATTTLTVAKPAALGGTVTYVGATAAALQSAASIDPHVTVTVSSLPSGNFGPTALASGADDYSNVSWATVLANITSAYGPGAVATPGVTASAAYLAAHATSLHRLALLSTPQAQAVATTITAQGNIAAADKQAATYVAIWGSVADGTGGQKVIDGVTFAATVRAKAQRILGLGTSALNRTAHALVTGFTPLSEVTDTEHTSLNTAGVVTARTLANGPGIDVWATPTGVGSNSHLTGAQFRDLVDYVVDESSTLLDQWVGRPASDLELAAAAAALTGVCNTIRPWLTDNGDLDPGYRVSVNHGASTTDNRISAVISLRFVESIDFVDITIIPASADQII
ncbi:MAG: hypothetical protein R2686_07140 [Candidatus Nanopelagicales bacterium]